MIKWFFSDPIWKRVCFVTGCLYAVFVFADMALGTVNWVTYLYLAASVVWLTGALIVHDRMKR